MKEELGDLLLQVVFHAQLAKERKEFDMEDILETLEEKLIRRHPHVFGDASYEDAKEVLVQWEKIKKEEKANSKRESMLNSVPKGYLLSSAPIVCRTRHRGSALTGSI